jgi:hypothetical protein
MQKLRRDQPDRSPRKADRVGAEVTGRLTEVLDPLLTEFTLQSVCRKEIRALFGNVQLSVMPLPSEGSGNLSEIMLHHSDVRVGS